MKNLKIILLLVLSSPVTLQSATYTFDYIIDPHINNIYLKKNIEVEAQLRSSTISSRCPDKIFDLNAEKTQQTFDLPQNCSIKSLKATLPLPLGKLIAQTTSIKDSADFIVTLKKTKMYDTWVAETNKDKKLMLEQEKTNLTLELKQFEKLVAEAQKLVNNTLGRYDRAQDEAARTRIEEQLKMAKQNLKEMIEQHQKTADSLAAVERQLSHLDDMYLIPPKDVKYKNLPIVELKIEKK